MTAIAVFLFYFGWPTGAVWSNLLASVICSAIVWWRLRARMILHHREDMAQQRKHHAVVDSRLTALEAGREEQQ
jgi:membrane protein implicated in regulation of membrane protease activity